MWLLRAIQSLRPAHTLSATAHERRAAQPLLRRSVAIALALALLLSGGIALAAPGAAYADAGGQRNRHATMDYLALGDSVAFGYNPLLDFNNANNFIGYPTPVANALDLKLTNAGCPGATSSYFISLSGPDWGCGQYSANFPLHVSYTTSQLDFAVSFLKAHPRTRLVSIDIGANDVFRLQGLCSTASNPSACIQQGLPELFATLSANLNIIYGAIRHEAHYHGQLVALTYYSLNYQDATTTGIVQAMNQVITARTTAWGGVIADGFDAFDLASAPYQGDPCAAGLLIRLSPTSCDVHPTPAGRDILAATILAVVKHNADRSVAA